MLVTNTLFGVVDKVEIALARLREFEPPEGYYGAFSGGKDSCVIKALAKMAGVRVDWHYNLTTVDPPELVQFIRTEHPDVTIHRPKLTMWQLIAQKKRMPPTRMARYCCEYLKEGRGNGHLDQGRRVMTGVRWAESTKRSKRRMVEACFRGNKAFLHPIIDFDDGDVWEFIKSESIPYCRLYDEGFQRLGCIACPMAGKNGMEREFQRWPKYKQAYLRAFARMIERCKGEGKPVSWATPEEVMTWWVNGARDTRDPDQSVMFE